MHQPDYAGISLAIDQKIWDARTSHYREKIMNNWNAVSRDNTRIDSHYFATGGAPMRYSHQMGGLVVTGNGTWEPAAKAKHVDSYPVDMKWDNPIELKFTEWALGLMMRITDPSTDLRGINDGDTIVRMDGGYWNNHPILSIITILNNDTSFYTFYHYPSNESLFKYGKKRK
ncbi:MAG: hypothetical protein QM786_15160 [Breznakibacter sp.]